MDNPVKTRFVAGRPWRRRIGIGVLSFMGLVIGIWLYVETTPPVVGRIVDARTRQLIGASVCESMEYSGWGWTTRTENFETSSRNGWFYLSPHFGAGPLARWIVFNDPSAQCRRDVGMALDFDYVTHGPRSSYFPVVLEQDKRNGGYHIWPATWRTIGFPLFVTVPMIPHLKDVGACSAIADAALREQCRQLNTYMASMDSVAEGMDESHVSHALGMCEQLTPETVAGLCEKNIKSLSAVDAAKRAQDAAIRFAHERDLGINNVALVPIEELFPETVSGTPRTDWDITEYGIGTGRAGYSAKYARKSSPNFSASLSVHEFRDAQHARDGLKELCADFTQVKLMTGNEEERGQMDTRRRRTKPRAVCWLSGKRVVQIDFLSGSDNRFVEAILQKFARP